MPSPRTTRVLYTIHKWTGLISGINVLILSVSAAYLLSEDVWRAWSSEEGRAPETQLEVVNRADRPPVQPVIDAVLAHYDGLEVTPARVDVGVLENQPDKVAFMGPNGFFRFVIAPDTGVLTMDYGTPPVPLESGPTPGGLVFATRTEREIGTGASPLAQWMLELHSDLFLGTIGTILTGLVGILLLVSTITGAIIYAPFTKALAFGMVRRGPGINHPASDLHKVVGVVTLAFNGVMALTGIGLTLGILAIQIYILAELREFEATSGEVVVAKEQASVERILAEGQRAMPDTWIYRIDYPGGMQGDKSYAIFAHDDPHSRGLIPNVAAVTADKTPRSIRFAMPLWVKIIVIGIPLHVASFGGVTVQFVYIFLALSTGLLSVTGFVMYAAKFRRKRPEGARPRGALGPSEAEGAV